MKVYSAVQIPFASQVASIFSPLGSINRNLVLDVGMIMLLFMLLIVAFNVVATFFPADIVLFSKTVILYGTVNVKVFTSVDV